MSRLAGLFFLSFLIVSCYEVGQVDVHVHAEGVYVSMGDGREISDFGVYEKESKSAKTTVWLFERDSTDQPITDVHYGKTPKGYSELFKAKPLKYCTVYLVSVGWPGGYAEKYFALFKGRNGEQVEIFESYALAERTIEDVPSCKSQ